MKLSLKILCIFAIFFSGIQLQGFAFAQVPLIQKNVSSLRLLSPTQKLVYGCNIVTAGSFAYCFGNMWNIMNNFKKINNNLNVINNSLSAINNCMQGTLVSEAVVIGVLMYKGGFFSKLWDYYKKQDENNSDENVSDDEKKN